MFQDLNLDRIHAVLHETGGSPWLQTDFASDRVCVRSINSDAEFLLIQNVGGNYGGANRVWLGLDKWVIDFVGQCCEEFVGKLDSELSNVLGRIIVIVCDSPLNLTDLGDGDACACPFSEDGGGSMSFLVIVPFPFPQRRVEDERSHLRAILSHELEHVWQFLTVRETDFGAPWREFAEMCAVIAEIRDQPGSVSHHEYGTHFLRCLAEGLFADGIDGDPVYWFYPFLSQLDDRMRRDCGIPDGCRGVWRFWEGIGDGDYPTSPWCIIDERLRDVNSNLGNEWQDFCIKVAFRVECNRLVQELDSRFSPRLPTANIDFEHDLRGGVLTLKSRPLSAHWIRLKGAKGLNSIRWTHHSVNPALRVCVKRTSSNEVEVISRDQWKLELGEYGDADLLLVNGYVPSVRSISDYAGDPIVLEFS